MITSDIIASIALVIAIAALIGTIWQLVLTKVHNTKSLRPVLNITCDMLVGSVVQFRLENYGLGPGFIKTLTYTVNDKPFSDFRTESIRDALLELGCERSQLHFSCITQLGDTPIGVGKEVILLSFPDTDHDEKRNRYISNLLSTLTISVEYESIYREKFTVKQTQNSIE